MGVQFGAENAQDIAHSADSLFSTVWSTLIDELVMLLLEAILFEPGHVVLHHENAVKHLPFMRLDLPDSQNSRRLVDVMTLYAVEPHIYMRKVVLEPLLKSISADPSMPTREQRRDLRTQMISDLLEASPYLMSSGRSERYMFSVPGTTCMATVTFLSPYGCARFSFSDDEAGVLNALHTNHMRGVLNVGYDGHISWWLHAKRTLEAVFGEDDGLLLEYWFLKQIHQRMVRDYLSIQNYYLHGSDEVATSDEVVSTPADDETLVYIAWAKAVDVENSDATASVESRQSAHTESTVANYGKLPQLRRRYFFKLLEQCGTEIEQGKGSEIKLLRKAKHPFRLGSHYGSNPTIPSFLAANILKRLEITRDEWIAALSAD